MQNKFDLDYYNSLATGTLTGHLGIVFTRIQEGEVVAEMEQHRIYSRRMAFYMQVV